MSWFICGRVLPVNLHETSCSSVISHAVVAIGGTLVRLRGRVMAGRVREGVDGLGGWIRVLLKQWVCVLILSSVLIDRSLGLSDDTFMLYSRASLRRRTETNIYGNTWLPNGSWSLSQFDQSTELRSTALQKLNGYVCIHLRWVRDWIIDPALFVLERTTQLRDKLHEKLWSRRS